MDNIVNFDYTRDDKSVKWPDPEVWANRRYAELGSLFLSVVEEQNIVVFLEKFTDEL